MRAATLILIAALAQPAISAQASDHDPGPVAVTGRVELTPGEADASARSRADREAGWNLERRAAEVVAAKRPVWLPSFVAERVLGDWLRTVELRSTYRILGTERAEHDHGDYRSFSTRLQVAADDAGIDRALRGLEHRIRVGSRRFAWLLGGTAGLWAFLALVHGWLDRLTRGYMPWRLRLVCVGMALAGPGIALLFV